MIHQGKTTKIIGTLRKTLSEVAENLYKRFYFLYKNIVDISTLFLEVAPPVFVIRPSFLDVSGNQGISDLICYKKSVSNGIVTTESSVVINVPCAMMVSPFSYWMQNKVP